jgi:hypothetical protein
MYVCVCVCTYIHGELKAGRHNLTNLDVLMYVSLYACRYGDWKTLTACCHALSYVMCILSGELQTDVCIHTCKCACICIPVQPVLDTHRRIPHTHTYAHLATGCHCADESRRPRLVRTPGKSTLQRLFHAGMIF